MVVVVAVVKVVVAVVMVVVAVVMVVVAVVMVVVAVVTMMVGGVPHIVRRVVLCRVPLWPERPATQPTQRTRRRRGATHCLDVRRAVRTHPCALPFF
jgi:hypothetical protein